MIMGFIMTFTNVKKCFWSCSLLSTLSPPSIASILSSFQLSSFHFHVFFLMTQWVQFIYVFVHVCTYTCFLKWGACVHSGMFLQWGASVRSCTFFAVVCMWRPEGSVQGSFLFSPHSSGDLTPVLRFGGKCLPTEWPCQPSVSLIRFA